MRTGILTAGLVLALCGLARADFPARDVTTTDGQTFKAVTGAKLIGDKVLLIYSDGTATVRQQSLSDETLKGLGLRSHAEQAAFEEQQKQKGLVRYGNEWVSPEEKRRRETPFMVYAGKPRTEAWFNEQYEKFKDSIVCADGKFKDISLALQGKVLPIDGLPPAPGTEIRYIGNAEFEAGMAQWAEVVQVIDKKSCLIHVMRAVAEVADVCTVRLTGCDTTDMADGSRLQGYGSRGQFVVYVGTYSYENVRGSKSTVQNFTPLRSLTKDEFKECLSCGFHLAE
jgi:hypothetical protein